MFAYTGLSKDQCDILTDKHHIYCTKNGRFSMAGVNPGNVNYIAEAIKDAILTKLNSATTHGTHHPSQTHTATYSIDLFSTLFLFSWHCEY